MHADTGSMLVEAGLITEDQLQQGLTTAVQYGGTLVQNLIRLGHVTDLELARFLSSKLKLPMAEESQFENLPAFITRLVPGDIVLAHRLVPIMLHAGVLHVAMSDATDRAALEEIGFATGYRTAPVVAPFNLVEQAMARYYGIPPEDSSIPEDILDQVRPRPTVEPQPVDEAPAAEVPPEPQEQQEVSADESHEPIADDMSVPAPVPEDSLLRRPPPAEIGLEQARERLEVVENGMDELEELFFGLGREDRGVVHLTRRKDGMGVARSGTIADAIRAQTDKHRHESIWENETIDAEHDRSEEAGPVEEHEPPPDDQEPDEPVISPLHHSETARIMLREAADRDEVARILMRFGLSYLHRVALFIVRKEVLVGWMGAGEELSSRRVKGIMIPLGPPSVFRTVRETSTDYFGSLPRTVVNDVFISAMGEIRPRQILLIPVTVRHKPICILYGDCGSSSGFEKDLSPVHLLVQDASAAFERIILRNKMNRRIIR